MGAAVSTLTLLIMASLPTAAGAGVAEAVRERAAQWLAGAEAHAPALLLGLALLLAVPPLALAGLALRRLGTKAPAFQVADEAAVTATQLAQSRPGAAWLEVEGEANRRVVLDPEIVRIGREEDNELRLKGPAVHRYHAVVQRSAEEAGIIITDVSSAEGHGILINGKRTTRARLRHGDRLEIGGTVLHFRVRQGG